MYRQKWRPVTTYKDVEEVSENDQFDKVEKGNVTQSNVTATVT